MCGQIQQMKFDFNFFCQKMFKNFKNSNDSKYLFIFSEASMVVELTAFVLIFSTKKVEKRAKTQSHKEFIEQI
jgi:hypothetical protein